MKNNNQSTGKEAMECILTDIIVLMKVARRSGAGHRAGTNTAQRQAEAVEIPTGSA
jgi:hypothetical protein